MTYQSEYMTVADVVNHVIQHDGCNDDSALKQIREWLTDASHRGHITLVAKWESMNDYPAAQLWDQPPNDPAFWQKARICGARVSIRMATVGARYGCGAKACGMFGGRN